MKRCNQCRIVFHNDDRNRCLYCDSNLLTVEADDSVDVYSEPGSNESNVSTYALKREMPLLKEVLKDWQLYEYLRLQYMVGTYFKVRTFQFMYLFSRNHYRMGKGYKRALVQPLNITALLTIPWVVIDLVDSLYIRASYNAFCLKCGWKFKQIHATQIHDPQECEYNQEYNRILNQILSGQILKTEGKIKQDAYAKLKEGKRSAYHDLCLSRRSGAGWFMDVLCVWFSICCVLIFIVMLIYPFFLKWATFLNTSD